MKRGDLAHRKPQQLTEIHRGRTARYPRSNLTQSARRRNSNREALDHPTRRTHATPHTSPLETECARRRSRDSKRVAYWLLEGDPFGEARLGQSPDVHLLERGPS